MSPFFYPIPSPFSENITQIFFIFNDNILSLIQLLDPCYDL